MSEDPARTPGRSSAGEGESGSGSEDRGESGSRSEGRGESGSRSSGQGTSGTSGEDRAGASATSSTGADRPTDAADGDGSRAGEAAGSDEGAASPGAGSGLLTRRRALIGAGLVGVGAVGYAVLSILNPPNAPRPVLPTDRMEADGWVETGGEGAPVTEMRVGPLTITTLANTVQYGNRGLLDAVRQRDVTVEGAGQTVTRSLAEAAPEALDQYLAIFVASRIDLGPDVDDLPLGIGRAEVMDQARAAAQTSFERTMADAGLQGISRTGSGTLAVDTGETAMLDRYRADFPFAGGTVSALGQEFDVPSTALEMAGYLAVWHHGDWIMVAAGAHPAANYSDSVERELDGGGTATVSLDLGLAPADYRDQILGYAGEMR